MWINYHSLFLIVRVRTGRVRLVIPLPLYVLDQALSALEDLSWLADRIVPGTLTRRINPCSSHPVKTGTFFPMVMLLRKLMKELRKYGRWRMVEIETETKGASPEKVRIYLDFY